MERRGLFCLAAAVYVLATALVAPAIAQYSGGSGTADDPYRIATAQDLISLGNTPTDYDKRFRLTADIDLTGYVFEQALIAPECDSSESYALPTHFTGVFDGNEHVIRHLQIEGGNCLGLFGYVGADATVTNLGVENVSIQCTGDYAGSLAGHSFGRIVNSYSAGQVIGNRGIGGLVGNVSRGSIFNSHSNSAVTGSTGVGGLAGYNSGSVSRCYSIGEVAATGRGIDPRGPCTSGGLIASNSGSVSDCWSTCDVTGHDLVAGLVGRNSGSVSTCYSTGAAVGNGAVCGFVANNSGSVKSCFWDVESSGVARDPAAVGLTTAEATSAEWIGLQGWGRDPNWVLNPNQDYPRLSWEETEGQMIPEPVIDWMAGLGTSEAPYGIVTMDQLLTISKASLLWDKSFLLMDDLDLAGSSWSRAVIPSFAGAFNGNGHRMRNLRISGDNHLGLFGRLEEDGQILNLELSEVDITGAGDDIGSVVGWITSGSVSACTCSGSIIGDDYVGGVAGRNSAGSVLNCQYNGSVTGKDYVGGLIGENSGNAQGCHSAGTVTANGSYVGGLTAYNTECGEISDCNSTATVWGNRTAAGLATINDGSISGCQSSGSVTAQSGTVGGLVAGNSGHLQDCQSSGAVTGFGIGGYWVHVGGLVGHNFGQVVNCRSSGQVVGGDECFVGGLVGRNSPLATILECRSECTVTGGKFVGGLVGMNYSSVSSCCSASTVSGTGVYMGGLVGHNTGNVSYCYTDKEAKVCGSTRYTGGLIGYSTTRISYCYSAGAVTGSDDRGGLIGYTLGRTEHSFWDTEVSGVAHSFGGAGLTTAEMMDPEWVGLQGWANEPKWVLNPHLDYPRLAWEETPGEMIPEPIVDWMAGGGTSERPYQIHNVSQLTMIGKASLLWDKSFELMMDLDLAEVVWPQAVIPSFSGTFEGNGHTIRNLRISGANNLGLLGNLETTGTIVNLVLFDVSVKGSDRYIGSIAGRNMGGTLSNCHGSGYVAGGILVGGLVGTSHYGNLADCSSAGTVTGNDTVGGLLGVNWIDASVSGSHSAAVVVTDANSVGGLVGRNFEGASVSDCYSTGKVAGKDRVGGLVGYNDGGQIWRSYSVGAVAGENHVGGAVGRDDCSDLVSSADISCVEQCFWDVETSGQVESAGGTGLTTAEMWDIDTYLGAGWDFVAETDNGVEDLWWIDEGKDYPHLWWERLE